MPKIPSMRVVDLARALAPECQIDIVGIRPGEKLHEVMIPEEAGRNGLEYNESFVLLPDYSSDLEAYRSRNGGRRCAEGFCYTSETNSQWLTAKELLHIIHSIQVEDDA